jgi:hypothetical protein
MVEVKAILVGFLLGFEVGVIEGKVLKMES